MIKFAKPFTIAAAVAIVMGFTGLAISKNRVTMESHGVVRVAPSLVRGSFPQIDSGQLSRGQQKVITILKQEYSAQPPGTKYSLGVNEAWCADFASWVFKEAGYPYTNPNSQSWRIPGTYTLREYYESIGQFKLASSGYSPKVGDVMLYDNPSSFGQHVNIVIKNEHGIITTVGGNEPGGIRVYIHKKQDKAGFLGYGVFVN